MRSRFAKVVGELQFPKAIKHFVRIEKSEINLLYAFIYFRNYAIAASVLFAGSFLFRYGASTMIPYAGPVLGGALLVTGVILFLFNFGQGVLATIVLKPSVPVSLAINVVLFLSTCEFIWVLIKVRLGF